MLALRTLASAPIEKAFDWLTMLLLVALSPACEKEYILPDNGDLLKSTNIRDINE